jgi:hypothetical protein
LANGGGAGVSSLLPPKSRKVAAAPRIACRVAAEVAHLDYPGWIALARSSSRAKAIIRRAMRPIMLHCPLTHA